MARLLFVLLCIITLCPVAVEADDPSEQTGGTGTHEHVPMRVRSRPVIERLPISVIDPADVLTWHGRSVVIADRRAGVIFVLRPDREVEVLAENLIGVCEMARAPAGNLLVAVNRTGATRICLITGSGVVSDVASLPGEVRGLATDLAGSTFAGTTSGRILKLTPDQPISDYARVPTAVRDVAADDSGVLYVLTESGAVYSVDASGTAVPVSQLGSHIQSLRIHPDGNLVGLRNAPAERPQLVTPGDRGAIRVTATLPSGTCAFAFDALGNLTLANPELRAVTQVNSHFPVSCPHCGGETLMILSPDAPPPPQQQGPPGISF